MADAMSVGSLMEIVTREGQSVINFYDPDLSDIECSPILNYYA